jgi:predicted ferric reductase
MRGLHFAGQTLLFATAAALGGLVAVGLSTPKDLPDPTTSMTSIHAYWYMGRASGFIAYGLLFASIALGLAVSSRVADGLLARPWVFDMHQFLSLFVLIAMLFHALILLPDPYAQFKLEELLVPFASRYRPLAVGAGAIVLYGSVIVSGSFYLKRFIGQQGWRSLHYATFALFVGATAHGVFAGSDSRQEWAQLTYLAAGLLVLFLTFFRILASKRAMQQAKRPSAPPREPAVSEGSAPAAAASGAPGPGL